MMTDQRCRCPGCQGPPTCRCCNEPDFDLPEDLYDRAPWPTWSNDKTQEEIVEAVRRFSLDPGEPPKLIDLSTPALESMRRRAMRATTGFATQEDQLYLDEVLAMISELIRLREGLQPVLDNKHFIMCAQKSDRPCACHYWMVHELIDQVD